MTYLNWLKRRNASPNSLARLLPNILYLEILNLIFIAPPLRGDTNYLLVSLEDKYAYFPVCEDEIITKQHHIMKHAASLALAHNEMSIYYVYTM